ncbi:MAG: hypothetical protein JWQ32_51 [Marmoricola sp.]|nr:hypothetical protein [Marmoricola sp.]
MTETMSAVDRFLTAVQAAAIADCDAWAEDATLDATVPNWRFHRHGVTAIRETYAHWFADPANFEELERTSVDGGEVVRYLLSWNENGVPHTAHHLHQFQIRDDRIVEDLVMCGGRWPAALMAEMEAADA